MTVPHVTAHTATPPDFLLSAAKERLEGAPARKCSVLLIEDQPDCINAVFHALASTARDIELVTAPKGAAALVEDRAFDVILLSLSTPEGVRTMMELKRAGDTPVVALVGGRDFFKVNYQLRMATALGANGAVLKPVPPERLRVAVERALDQRRES